jgi:hypothetical protein
MAFQSSGQSRGRTISIALGVALATAALVGVRPSLGESPDSASDRVRLQWSPSPDVDGYAVWRCAGPVERCPISPGMADPRWTKMATFSGKDACAKTPCSGSIREPLRGPLSYVVIAIRGDTVSAASNVITLGPKPSQNAHR